ncbi:DNA replication/repair protein RecF [Microbaculum marinum]|uniref:DNA replication and repair protein RecF n=1 Tax=Microbaculum marinum TaxID=1764581 RepID=A0AAW9RL38_9HYPH
MPNSGFSLAENGERGGGRVSISRLTLTDFRNYAGLRLDLDPRPVVLTGANGAGKTNLLEAVSYLTPGRGLRAAQLDSVIRLGAGAFAVAAGVDRRAGGPDVGAIDIGTGFRRGDSGRVVRVNHEPAPSVSVLGEIVRALWLTPAMDGLFTGPASDRRRFLDRLVLTLDPGHASRVADFEKAMRQRNRLLEDFRGNDRWLGSVEHAMAELGVAVSTARAGAVRRLTEALRQRAGGVFPDPEIAIEGAFETGAGDQRPSLEVEEAYREELGLGRARDAAAGRTLSGPHRSDLSVIHRGRGVPAALASTGEQKGLLIALILAHARLVADASGGVAPLLLLDEIAAHLDDMRRSALFAEILALGAQAWMTGTDRALFTDIAADAQCLEVADGRLSPV